MGLLSLEVHQARELKAEGKEIYIVGHLKDIYNDEDGHIRNRLPLQRQESTRVKGDMKFPSWENGDAKFIAEIPEIRIADVKVGQKVLIELITGEKIEGKLSFVSKSASPQTKTFRVESEISNPLGAIKDGVTSTITIQTDAILSHKISPSILDLDDSGNIGVKVLDSENIIRFVPIYIVEDLEEGLWISGIPGTVDLVVKGHGFVEDGQMILDSKSN